MEKVRAGGSLTLGRILDDWITTAQRRQGKALIRAIKALNTIDPTGPFERAIPGLLLAAYKRRLRAVVVVAPGWVVEEILGAIQEEGNMR